MKAANDNDLTAWLLEVKAMLEDYYD